MMQAQHGGQILRYATIVLGYTGTPGCAIFLLGMFCSRINEKVTLLLINIAKK